MLKDVLTALDALNAHQELCAKKHWANEYPRLRAEGDRLIHEFWTAAAAWLQENRGAIQSEHPQPCCKLCGSTWLDHQYRAGCQGGFPQWLTESVSRCAEATHRSDALSHWIPKFIPPIVQR